MSDVISVLSIIGAGRSGSTLLDVLLGSVNNAFATGELRYLWESRESGGFCGCGQAIKHCDIWRSVLRNEPGNEILASVEPEQVRAWQRRWARSRHTLRLLRLDPKGDKEIQPLLELMGALYRRIARVTNAHLIIDSSKRPSDASILRLIPGIRPFVVHLVRDPRAVAYSWQRRKREPGVGEDIFMPNRSALRSTRVWLELNVLSEIVVRRYGPDRALLLRYEDFAAHPAESVTAILRLIGIDAPIPVDDNGLAVLAPNHTVGGNPDRFRHGTVHIRPDDHWMTRVRSPKHCLIAAACAPLMNRYGYPMRPTQMHLQSPLT